MNGEIWVKRGRFRQMDDCIPFLLFVPPFLSIVPVPPFVVTPTFTPFPGESKFCRLIKNFLAIYPLTMPSLSKAASSSCSDTPKKKQQPMSVKIYLLAYNFILFIGWSVIFYLSITHVLEKKSIDGLWKKGHIWVKIFQTAAILEVVHSAIGIIPSNPFITLMQVYSRVFVVWGIIVPIKQAETSMGVPLLFIAWTITEMIRYSYYFLNLFSSVPHWLIWCRYSFFIVLYPMGVLGELICMYSALPQLKASQMWSLDLPNKFNFSFNYHYYVMLIMLSYIPGLPQLYFYMLGQRQKILGAKKSN